MNVVDISRWQFGITTVYHFIFVPLTIGLAPLIAVMQTVWVATGNTAWYRLTKFFGKLFLINFAHRRGDRDRAGIPVRHELERVLAVRRRHLRCPAGHRGPGRVLLRVHVPRVVDLRLEPAAASWCTWHASGLSRSRSMRPRSSSSRRTPSCSTRSAPTTTPRPGAPS